MLNKKTVKLIALASAAVIVVVVVSVGVALGVPKGNSKSQNCTPGQRVEGSSCEDCAPGTYSILKDAPECTVCGAGYYSSQPRQSTCLTCADGKFEPGLHVLKLTLSQYIANSIYSTALEITLSMRGCHLVQFSCDDLSTRQGNFRLIQAQRLAKTVSLAPTPTNQAEHARHAHQDSRLIAREQLRASRAAQGQAQHYPRP